MCVRKHVHGRGVWGYVPPGKFCKLDALRLLLRPLLAQTGTTVIIVICIRIRMYDSNSYCHAVAVAEESKPLSFQC